MHHLHGQDKIELLTTITNDLDLTKAAMNTCITAVFTDEDQREAARTLLLVHLNRMREKYNGYYDLARKENNETMQEIQAEHQSHGD